MTGRAVVSERGLSLGWIVFYCRGGGSALEATVSNPEVLNVENWGRSGCCSTPTRLARAGSSHSSSPINRASAETAKPFSVEGIREPRRPTTVGWKCPRRHFSSPGLRARR